MIFGFALVVALLSLPQCPTEDSPNCVWDAQAQGNHLGQSRINLSIPANLIPS